MFYNIGDFFLRSNDAAMSKGDIVDGHKHNFDHVTIVWGRMLVEVLDDDGLVVTSREYGEGLGEPLVLIRAGTRHRLTALQDHTHYRCLYIRRETELEDVNGLTGDVN